MAREKSYETRQRETRRECIWGGIDGDHCSAYIDTTSLVCSTHSAIERQMGMPLPEYRISA